MNKTFFTVVIPTHNRSNLLKRAINSVLNQTFEDFELIVVDDHSTDDTSFVVMAFSDCRIQYVPNHRMKGACGSRNTGIFSAKGQWVAFLDDDDEWLPEKLDLQYKTIQKSNSEIGMICSDYIILKGKNKKPALIKNRPTGWIQKKVLYGYSIGCLSSVVVRTDILRSINGFDERFKSSQDWDLWFRISEVCEVTNVPRLLVKMHQEERKDRIGQNYEAKLAGHVQLRNKYFKAINSSPVLRHRHESLIFTYAVLESKKSLVYESLPWFLLGAFIDTNNFIRTIRTVIILSYRNIKHGAKILSLIK